MPTSRRSRYRHSRRACPTSIRDNDLSYAGNFLSMMKKMAEPQVRAEPGARARARRALHPARRPRAELLDHRDARGRQLAGRSVLGRGGGGRGALRPAARRRQRGRAAHAQEIGTQGNVPAFIKQREGAASGRADGLRPPRVQELRPARASSSRSSPTRSSRSPARNPLLDIALELEKIALEDDYFIKRKLYPNVDFYSGLIYQAMGFPVDMFPVLFAIPRTAGLAGAVGGDDRSTRSRRSPARGRSTPARASATTCRWPSASLPGLAAKRRLAPPGAAAVRISGHRPRL